MVQTPVSGATGRSGPDAQWGAPPTAWQQTLTNLTPITDDTPWTGGGTHSSSGSTVTVDAPAGAADSDIGASSSRIASSAAGKPRDHAPVPRPVDGRRRLLGIPVGQLMIVQLAVVAVLPFLSAPTDQLIISATAAGLVSLACLLPVKGRFLWRWLWDYVSWLVRSRTVEAGNDARHGLLGSLLRNAEIRDVDVAGDLGAVLLDEAGSVVVLSPADGADDVIVSAAPLPSPAMFLPAIGVIPVPVCVQLVVAVTPTAKPVGRRSSVADESYRTLTKGAVPREQRVFYAVRICRDSMDRSDSELIGMAVAVARWAIRRMRKHGVPMRVLSGDELAGAVAETAGMSWDQSDRTRPPGKASDGSAAKVMAAREHWRHWRVGDDAHVTYRLRGWPRSNDPTWRFLDQMNSLPVAGVVWAVAALRTGAMSELECLVRVIAEDTASLRSATSAMARLGHKNRIRLHRLDGLHRQGIAGTVPIGGFTR